MRIGILGTRDVGRTLATRLVELGHEVMLGTRDVTATMARTEAGDRGQPAFPEWLHAQTGVQLGTFAEAAAFGDLLMNATSGDGSLPALQAAGDDALGSKVLIDISNPLDFSNGFPPSLSVSNTDSLAEQLQRAHPSLRVVKSLNTMTAAIMLRPDAVGGSDHHVFMAGNDQDAKAQAADLLRSAGWQHILDVGDLTAARGLEMLLPIWVRLWGALGTPVFNFKIVV